MIYPSAVFQPVKAVLPNDLEVVYSNAPLLRYCEDEVALDFTRLLPGTNRRTVDARVVMTPHNALRLLQALEDSICRYERKYGPVRLSRPGAHPQQPPQGTADTRKPTPLLPPPLAQQSSNARPQPAQASAKPAVEVPADLRAIRSNYAIVICSPLEIIIDFACLAPNGFKTEIATRVVVSPAGAGLLFQTLEGGLARYEDKYGEIRQPAQPNPGEPAAAHPDLWGGALPFALN